MPGQLRTFSRFLAALGLMVLILGGYFPGLSGPFLLDDFPNIVEKEEIKLTELGFRSLVDAATAYGDRFPHYRPVSTITLALDYWLWGSEPFGFKVTNLLIHLATFALLFLLARQLFRQSSGRSDEADGFWPALAVAGLWAVHPLQVSTVLYVVQRMEMLAALFIVLSLLAYIAGRRRLESGAAGGWPLLGVAGICTLLALFSKETGALAPFFMLAVELVLFRFSTHDLRAARVLKLGFSALIVGALLLYLFWMVPTYVFGDAFVPREFTWYERLLTQLRVLPMYLGWILVPATDHYLFYYDHFAHSEGLLEPVSTLGGALLLLILIGVAWWLRRRAPLVTLGILWFFLAHALTSNVVSLELVFEHRNYLAIFGVLIALAVFIRYAAGAAGALGTLPIITALTVLGLGLLALIRAAMWGDHMTLGLHHVHANPESERAGLDLAELYLGNGSWTPEGGPFLNSAIAQLERVAKLPTARTTADQALIVLAAHQNRPAPADAWNRLLQKVRKRALNAADYDAIYNLVQRRYLGLGISDERLWQLHAALCERNDIPAQVHARFGYVASLVIGDHARATSAFRRAIQVLEGSGESAEALRTALANSNVQLVDGIEACDQQVESGRQVL